MTNNDNEFDLIEIDSDWLDELQINGLKETCDLLENINNNYYNDNYIYNDYNENY